MKLGRRRVSVLVPEAEAEDDDKTLQSGSNSNLLHRSDTVDSDAAGFALLKDGSKGSDRTENNGPKKRLSMFLGSLKAKPKEVEGQNFALTKDIARLQGEIEEKEEKRTELEAKKKQLDARRFEGLNQKINEIQALRNKVNKLKGQGHDREKTEDLLREHLHNTYKKVVEAKHFRPEEPLAKVHCEAIQEIMEDKLRDVVRAEDEMQAPMDRLLASHRDDVGPAYANCQAGKASLLRWKKRFMPLMRAARAAVPSAYSMSRQHPSQHAVWGPTAMCVIPLDIQDACQEVETCEVECQTDPVEEEEEEKEEEDEEAEAEEVVECKDNVGIGDDETTDTLAKASDDEQEQSCNKMMMMESLVGSSDVVLRSGSVLKTPGAGPSPGSSPTHVQPSPMVDALEPTPEEVEDLDELDAEVKKLETALSKTHAELVELGEKVADAEALCNQYADRRSQAETRIALMPNVKELLEAETLRHKTLVEWASKTVNECAPLMEELNASNAGQADASNDGNRQAAMPLSSETVEAILANVGEVPVAQCEPNSKEAIINEQLQVFKASDELRAFDQETAADLKIFEDLKANSKPGKSAKPASQATQVNQLAKPSQPSQPATLPAPTQASVSPIPAAANDDEDDEENDDGPEILSHSLGELQNELGAAQALVLQLERELANRGIDVEANGDKESLKKSLDDARDARDKKQDEVVNAAMMLFEKLRSQRTQEDQDTLSEMESLKVSNAEKDRKQLEVLKTRHSELCNENVNLWRGLELVLGRGLRIANGLRHEFSQKAAVSLIEDLPSSLWEAIATLKDVEGGDGTIQSQELCFDRQPATAPPAGKDKPPPRSSLASQAAASGKDKLAPPKDSAASQAAAFGRYRQRSVSIAAGVPVAAALVAAAAQDVTPVADSAAAEAGGQGPPQRSSVKKNTIQLGDSLGFSMLKIAAPPEKARGASPMPPAATHEKAKGASPMPVGQFSSLAINQASGPALGPPASPVPKLRSASSMGGAKFGRTTSMGGKAKAGS